MQYGMMGMHAAFTLSDRTLEACMEALPPPPAATSMWRRGLEDARHSLQTYGKSIVRRLRDKGILGARPSPPTAST